MVRVQVRVRLLKDDGGERWLQLGLWIFKYTITITKRLLFFLVRNCGPKMWPENSVKIVAPNSTSITNKQIQDQDSILTENSIFDGNFNY